MNEIVKRQQASMSIPDMANAISQSGLFGKMNQAQVMGLMLISEAEGIHPAQAMREYHIIQGKPALKAEAMLAKYQNAGGIVEWEEYTNEKVSGYFYHPKVSPKKVLISWTIQDAQTAGLLSNKTWKQYPKAMLRSRVVSEGVRTVLPAVILGLYTPEETEGFTTPDVIDVTEVEQSKPKVTVVDFTNKLIKKYNLRDTDHLIEVIKSCDKDFTHWPDLSDKPAWVSIDKCISEYQQPNIDTSTGEVVEGEVVEDGF